MAADSRRAAAAVDPDRTVLVGGLPEGADAGDVLGVMCYCGEVVYIGLHPDVRRPGWQAAVVTFADPAARDTALLLHSADIAGAPCEVDPVTVRQAPLTSQDLLAYLTPTSDAIGGWHSSMGSPPRAALAGSPPPAAATHSQAPGGDVKPAAAETPAPDERRHRRRGRRRASSPRGGGAGALFSALAARLEGSASSTKVAVCGAALLAAGAALGSRSRDDQARRGRGLIHRELRALTLESDTGRRRQARRRALA
eukprot:TRINITY_DN25671_c0_g1_i1.p1 TRINITY_DN25671_c0_g1~~TRINITY_DN25671_c0_g1_i1.p1  ORF type:complete len:278 (+),score=74.36 TRINITY_DN25671_c0_g1_i1:73-834(+)